MKSEGKKHLSYLDIFIFIILVFIDIHSQHDKEGWNLMIWIKSINTRDDTRGSYHGLADEI